MKNWRAQLMPLLGLVIAAVIGCHRQAAPSTAGDTLTVALSTNTIRVGDLIQLRLTSVHGTNLHLNPPELGHGKEILVRARRDTGVRLPDGRVREVLDYAITSLVTGHHIIATSPGVVWTRPDGTTTQAPFPFVAFKVQSMLTSTNADLSQVRDLHDLARWPDRFPRWLLALLIAAMVVGLGAWLLRLYLAHAREVAAHAPQIPAHEIALLALKMLLEKKWIEEENFRPFYWELTDILRYYVENRYGVHAPERTTEEFLVEVTQSKLLHEDTQQLLFSILEYADAVKFARLRPTQADMRAAYAAAEKLVKETISVATEDQDAVSAK
jgi:hypothetical protein